MFSNECHWSRDLKSDIDFSGSYFRGHFSLKHNWLNIYERIEYNKGVLLFKSVHGLCPSYISELFTFQNSNVYSLRSATNSNMCLPRPNREIFKRTFQFSGVQIWNKLPTAVRSANTISSFKNLLVKHIKSKRTTNL